jgi:hypothetical protein
VSEREMEFERDGKGEIRETCEREPDEHKGRLEARSPVGGVC